MADGALPTMSLKGKVSEAEWQARVDLAALYRLVALHGWDDMIFTHISARIPGPEHHFLINPYGMFFGEITASSLVKVDLEGNVIDKTPYYINPAGFTIHSAVHAAREDAHYVMHLHSDQGVAVSAHKEGLLPLTQHSLIVLPQLAYHDYEGIALNLEERERIVADLGQKKLLMLRNHGTLSVGATAAECWLGMFFLERACAQQVMALSIGRDNVLLAPEAAQDEVRKQIGMGMGMIGGLAWPGCLRKLDRESPGYAD
ncbi:class II aldolase/adducin family protein [Caulobacter vibrioides]|uniref:Putative aldolase class 2 protein CC_1201 n=2 Tax=Caulobacter vibrioides TaxID=155892 RepID=Y1201_CAUVC|nr:class II aldolase/adducin family protein [Caulobacter vibrioides]YP_002516632.1 class II aldolase and Adducin protein [Caulobacter vibrioides NA1000]Q9A8Z4.2 RecName: Full=Putative aldolase class 2 protein CC_1201 [Caulobacter vibrioides CB15]ACL94724.1 class II aldolase and Adducin protein [Caulobacter vibrioides NA1000]ATC24143.1 class II aldolase [Caulobacter vibrioides]ATC28027.1 class II aldolase [Caulobacter vibrioides]AZH12390.1 class II aldolase/adducin family protein [Caulobacter 